MSMLRCEKVTKIYKVNDIETRALQEVDFAMEQGEFTALAGPSGSGKTTLLNLMGGLDETTAGRIFLGHNEITAMSQAQLSDLRLHHLGFIFQAYNLIPVLSAIENVEYVMLLQGLPENERRSRAEAILKEVGLGELINKRPNQMSGGQQQRVAVARAIVSLPDLILADEPTANLDSQTSHELLDMMRKLNEEKGITFLFSTHDPLVMEHSRRLVKLRDGRIVEDEKRG